MRVTAVVTETRGARSTLEEITRGVFGQSSFASYAAARGRMVVDQTIHDGYAGLLAMS